MSISHKVKVLRLYRHSLKHLMSWAIRRNIFSEEAENIRAEFERNRNVNEPYQARRLCEQGEAVLHQYRHPDPYIVPYHPGGSLYARNPPMVPGLKQQLDWGKEDPY